MLSARDPTQNKRYTQTESERMEQIFHANGNENKQTNWGSNTYT